MKALFNIISTGVLILLLIGTVNASESFTKTGTAGAQFLKIGVGAKYSAMGDASVATVDDAYALYWNPAAMGRYNKSYLDFTNIQWIEGVNLHYISYAKPTVIGNFGVAVTALTSGDIEVTTIEQPDGTGEFFSTSSYAITIGYSKQMTDYFSVGVSTKYISERISEERASGIAFDFGTLLHPGYKNLRIGMNISNLGPQMKLSGPELDFNYNPSPGNESVDNTTGELAVTGYDLPLMFRIGAAYDLQYSANTRLTLSVEVKDPSDNTQQGSIGSEIAFKESLFLRGGWKLNYEEESYTLGGGLILKIWETTDLVMNYAWADFGRLSSVHRFSFGFRF